MNINEKYYSGTSGLVLPYKNKTFYPPEFQNQSRLTFYGSLFNSIEINSSFYKIPKAATVLKWADSVPGHFRFTFKLWKGITHAKDLQFDSGDVASFMTTINAASHKAGCLLVQFPASIKYSLIRQFQKLMECIQSNNQDNAWKISFEFRDTSWYKEEVYRLLEEQQCGMIIHDKTGSQTSMDDMQGRFIYLRFHGPGGDYRGSYEDHFLAEYATYIQEWLKEDKEVFVYFNNTMGEAINNLKTLNQYVNS